MIISLTTFSQVKYSVKLSDKHQKRVEQTKDVRKRFKRYRKLMHKSEKKARKREADSLGNVAVDKAEQRYDLEVPSLPDSASREDSISWVVNTLAQYHQEEELQQYVEQLVSMDSSEVPSLDSLVLDPIAEEAFNKYLSDELSQQAAPTMESIKQDQLSTLEGELPTEALDHMEGLATDPKAEIDAFQDKVKAQQLEKVQGRLSKLKEKYVTLPSMGDESTGIKRNSLKGEPLWKRIYLTGNVAVQSTEPVVLDTDFRVGYKINQQLVTGVGVRWREVLVGKMDSASRISDQAHGYSWYIDQSFKKGLFLHGEIGAVKNTSLFREGADSPFVKWEYECLAGLGRTFKLGKMVSMSTMILYDFNHRNNDIHPRPFVVKVGMNLEKMPWKGAKLWNKK